MLDIVRFSLDNAFFTLGDKIIQQVHGIPMGDPMSPAMCIGTCAYIEMQWFDSLPADVKPHIRFTRYLDDIFMVANRSNIQNYDELVDSFVKRCYPSCLELEETNSNEYLECKVVVNGSKLNIYHWNKNHIHMQSNAQQYYYKGQHMQSYTTDQSRRGALIGTWTRVQDNSNNSTLMSTAILQKCDELRTLSYTTRYIKNTLRYMHKKTKSNHWLIDIE